jgi:hypothetical protein
MTRLFDAAVFTLRVLVLTALLTLMFYPFVRYAHANNEDLHHHPSLCGSQTTARQAVEARHGKWIMVTTDQWEWLRGVYVLNPTTPSGLPPGDRAVLAKVEGDKGGMIFFIDGELACTPMTLPDELIDLMYQIDGTNIFHDGSPL